MYLDYFRLRQEPFSIAPDPSFLYLSESHNEALAHLLYGFSHGGFVLVTGEVGTGKTTLLRNLVKQTPDELDVAFVLNPRLTVKELLESIADELGIRYDKTQTQTVKQYIDLLNAQLLRAHTQGRTTVLIIDEAQNLSPAVLEQIRLLTNLETDEKKLLRIILIGQPELDEMLARQELRQLAQRITARYHLRALNAADTSAYVAHRITKAGGQADIFPQPARRTLFKVTKGIPRLINVIADRALLGAFTRGERQVTPALVRAAADEIAGRRPKKGFPLTGAAIVVLVLGILAVAIGLFWQPSDGTEQVATPAPAQRAAGPLAPARTETNPPAATPAAAEPDEPMPGQAIEPAARLDFGTTTTQPQTAAAAQPADPEAPFTDRIERPSGSTYRGQRQAYAAVFAAWGARYDIETPTVPCDFAPASNLNCASTRGLWSDLRRIDLPVVLELWDDIPQPFYAALTRISSGELTLNIHGETVATTQQALRNLWFGNYTLVWPTPLHYRGPLQLGDTHASVGTLRNYLERASGMKQPTAEPHRFDAKLEHDLRNFQQSAGLDVDGIVGPLTWLALMRTGDTNMPSLARGP